MRFQNDSLDWNTFLQMCSKTFMAQIINNIPQKLLWVNWVHFSKGILSNWHGHIPITDIYINIPVDTCHQWPITQRFCELLNWTLVQILFVVMMILMIQSCKVMMILMIQSGHNFCTCHNSSAVVTCAKFWPDQIIILQNKINKNFYKILIMSS